MEIVVNQKKISIGDKYKILVDGQESYVASRQLYQLLPVVDLFKVGEDRARMTISKLFAWIKEKYEIARWDGNILSFRTSSIWRRQYECRVGPDCYAIYGHLGRKYSIFKNDAQVAWWDKNALSILAGDHYKIIADRDADVELLIAFCLIVDNFSGDDHDNQLISIDIGNIGFRQKKFDHSWQPKL